MRNLLLFILIASLFGSSCNEIDSGKLPESDKFRLNQLGFYPESVKQFILVDSSISTFEIIDLNGKVAFSGMMSPNMLWKESGENICYGDFSQLKTEGVYYIIADNKIKSHSFEIKKSLYKEALKASIKSYYFQRASMPIEKKYDSIYHRNAGHPDDNCTYHPSTGYNKGSLKSTGGWYDAGDYGKYIVNASLSTGQMLQLAELYPNAIADASLNIPESGNKRSDLLDELKYELDWIISMQDADGGVFHKLTAKKFSGFIMPEEYDLERMIIGKGTAATLDFAAVMAQSARIYDKPDREWSKKALAAAVKAWDWAILNNNIAYANPKDVATGAYDDDKFSDDFYWAAAELYITTLDHKYHEYLKNSQEPYIHEITNSWKFFVRNNGFHSLILSDKSLDKSLIENLKTKHLELSDSIVNIIEEHPYKIALNRYEWGSNSDILNQAMILCIAHSISKNEKYLRAAEQINDYIFGKNATAYCFLTGYGHKQIMFPHHRPSGADGIVNPIPGFIAGGPNIHMQDKSQVDYPNKFPAKAYVDTEDSYASNEVCINWNSPAVFVLAYLEQNR